MNSFYGHPSNKMTYSNSILIGICVRMTFQIAYEKRMSKVSPGLIDQIIPQIPTIYKQDLETKQGALCEEQELIH